MTNPKSSKWVARNSKHLNVKTHTSNKNWINVCLYSWCPFTWFYSSFHYLRVTDVGLSSTFQFKHGIRWKSLEWVSGSVTDNTKQQAAMTPKATHEEKKLFNDVREFTVTTGAILFSLMFLLKEAKSLKEQNKAWGNLSGLCADGFLESSVHGAHIWQSLDKVSFLFLFFASWHKMLSWFVFFFFFFKPRSKVAHSVHKEQPLFPRLSGHFAPDVNMMAIAAVQQSGPVQSWFCLAARDQRSPDQLREFSTSSYQQGLWSCTGWFHSIGLFIWRMCERSVCFFCKFLWKESQRSLTVTSYLSIFLFLDGENRSPSSLAPLPLQSHIGRWDKWKTQSSRYISSDFLVQVLLGQRLDKGFFFFN